MIVTAHRNDRSVLEIPPNDLDAERAVLGAPLLEEDPVVQARVVDVIVERTTPEMFYLEAHRTVRRHFERMRGGPVTWQLLKSSLDTADELDEVGGSSAIALLMEQGCIEGLLRAYIDQIREKYVERRRLQLGLAMTAPRNGTPLPDELRATRDQLVQLETMLGGEAEDPPIVDVNELLAERYETAPAIVAGGIVTRGGMTLVGARPKSGKTALATQLAICRALSLPWLGCRVTPGRTLYFNAEIPQHALQARVQLQTPDGEALPEGALAFVTRRGLYLDQADGLATVRRLIARFRADLVVFDPLARFMTGDENSNKEVGRLIASLDELSEAFDVAFLISHHLGKPTAGDAREGGERLRGASALYAAADAILMLDRENDGHFRLSFELRHAAEREPLRLERSDRLWFSEAGPAEDLLTVAGHVAAVGLRFKGLKNALVQDADVSERTAERMIARTRKAGLIALDDSGIYRATDKYRHARGDGEETS